MSNTVDAISNQQKMRAFLLEAARSRCLVHVGEVISAQLGNRINDEVAMDQITMYMDWYNQFKEAIRNLP